MFFVVLIVGMVDVVILFFWVEGFLEVVVGVDMVVNFGCF